MMCESAAGGADLTSETDGDETRLFEREALTAEQMLGEACAVCHAKWPRPRTSLGRLPDGSMAYGCTDCAEIAASYTDVRPRSLAAR